MKKKVFSLLLSCVLMLGLLPSGALAAETNAGTLPFSDVPVGAWYYDAVALAAKDGWITGVTATRFAPDEPMTRGMLVTVLHRLAGTPKAAKQTPFSDVAAGTWYYDAVEWAAANGIVTGYDGAFAPNSPVTREQAAAVLQRFAKFQSRDTSGASELTGFSDASAVSAWARDAMGWAVSSALISGTDGGALAPQSGATRAQTAVILSRYRIASELETVSDAYVAQFLKGNFKDFYNDSDETMHKSTTVDQLSQLWAATIQSIGTPGKVSAGIYGKTQGYSAVTVPVECTLYKLNVTFVYDSEGTPAGLSFLAAPKDAPAAQSSGAWQEYSVTVGEKSLPGMLTVPKNVSKPPVVILVQGSGSSDMNEALGTVPNKPFEDLAHGLAEQGVATLRYNKRSYQYPAEAAKVATIQYEMLDDAAAAVKQLSADSRVDGSRIYLLGHSLGGMMAPKIAADNPQVKGFVSLAGSLRSLQDIMLDQVKASIAASTALTAQQKTDQLVQSEAMIAQTKTLDDGGSGFIAGIPTAYWKSLNEIDSKSIVQSLSVPMLILQGSADFQVYPDKDYKLWQDTLSGRKNVTFKLYDSLSHLFMPNQVSSTGAPDVTVYNAPNHVDTTVIKDIAGWVKGQ